MYIFIKLPTVCVLILHFSDDIGLQSSFAIHTMFL